MDARTLRIATRAAVDGPEAEKLNVDGHHFNVKPAQVVSGPNGGVTIIGTLSHHLSLRPDDQVAYRARVEDGAIAEVVLSIDRGGLAPLSAPVVSALAAYFTGKPVPPDDVESVARSLGRALDGGWEAAAEALVAGIAISVAQRQRHGGARRPRVRDKRRRPR